MYNEKCCCFTGHRTLPANKLQTMITNLDREIDRLIEKGVTNFISGGALGFDQIAASLIVAKKETGKEIRLVFALPCKDQDALWSDKQKEIYNGLLVKADEIIYVSESYDPSCMKRRNHFMVEHSAFCL